MALDFSFTPRLGAAHLELTPTELARVELVAVGDYDNPAFPPELIESATSKAMQRVNAAFSSKALEAVDVPRFIEEKIEGRVDSRPNSEDESDLERRRHLSLLDTADPFTEELADIVSDMREKAASDPEYTDEEVVVVRAALGWRALTAWQPAVRKAAKAARAHVGETVGRTTIAKAHCRHVAHVAFQHAQVALLPFLR